MDLCVKGGQATEKFLVPSYASCSLQMQISSGKETLAEYVMLEVGFWVFLFPSVKAPKLTNLLHRTVYKQIKQTASITNTSHEVKTSHSQPKEELQYRISNTSLW